MVASDDTALLIHAQAAVSITVVGKADVEMIFHNELLQTLNVGRTSIVIDIRAVRLVVDNVGIGPQRIEYRLGDVPGTAVGTVQTNLDTLERVDSEADQIAHVAVAAGHIVHRAANVLPVSEGQLRPVLIEHVQFAIDVVLN